MIFSILKPESVDLESSFWFRWIFDESKRFDRADICLHSGATHETIGPGGSMGSLSRDAKSAGQPDKTAHSPVAAVPEPRQVDQGRRLSGITQWLLALAGQDGIPLFAQVVPLLASQVDKSVLRAMKPVVCRFTGFRPSWPAGESANRFRMSTWSSCDWRSSGLDSHRNISRREWARIFPDMQGVGLRSRNIY
ncbi:hypothetical protein [Burkholderia sp. BCC0322]|uniref:hypothetical protein n=1 Tax=unclassified Burkholderia TaxID=2613784 RepID=UPI00158D4591|nr:hypothetical protein [Burkholderia sp. BCC0322]